MHEEITEIQHGQNPDQVDLLNIPEEQARQQLAQMKERELEYYEKSVYRQAPKRDHSKDQEIREYFEELMSEDNINLDYPTARYFFYKIWVNLIGDKKPYLEVEDRWIVENFVKWLIRDKTCLFDLKKGILFMGVNGCGKSTLLRAGMYFSAKYLSDDRHYHIKEVMDMLLEVEEARSISAILPYTKGNWAYDDIGKVNEDIQVFGNKYNIVEILMNKRDRSNHFTLGTTNMIPAQKKEDQPEGILDLEINKNTIRGKYGDAVASRFNRIFNFAIFTTQQDCSEL